jgi:Zn-dependent protease with chaperone function
MTVAVLVPLVVSVLLGVGGPVLAPALRPAAAVRCLTVGAVTAALAMGFSLTVVAMVVLAGVRDIAVLGHWSPAELQIFPDVPWPVGLAAAGVVVVLLMAAAVHTVRAGTQLWSAEILCRRLGAARCGNLPFLVADDTPDAYAVPGIRGRIVVTTAMFAALTAAERDVLLAHEAAHLNHRHHLWIQFVELAAVANPLLRRLPPVVRYAAERWADEDAAQAVGDRRLTAHAIAHAALAGLAARRREPRTSGDSVILAATGGDVPLRVHALLHPPQLRWSRPAAAMLTAVAFAACASSAIVGSSTEHRFERAHAGHAQNLAATATADPTAGAGSASKVVLPR